MNYKIVLDYYCDWIGFKLTRRQFEELLNDAIRADIEEMGEDTTNREMFMDNLAMKITGMNWPIGKTSKEKTQEFFTLMKIRGKEMGYDIPDDYDKF